MNYRSLRITVEPHAGSSIVHVCCEICHLAETTGETFEIKFNDFKLKATPTTKPQDLIQAYWICR